MQGIAWLLVLGMAWAGHAEAGDACAYRGDLAATYCDANRDMVADMPEDPQRRQDPAALVFAYAPVENSTVYETLFKPFTDFLAQCVGRPVSFLSVPSHTAEVDAMRAGRLHVAGFSTGTTVQAVRNAGAVPFAEKGYVDHPQGLQVLLIVRKDRPYRKLSDLKGKVVAHTAVTSLSGHWVPTVLFPKEGLVPGNDYGMVFSGKHDLSIMGVRSGVYDAAAVSSSVFDRMTARGEIREDDFRVLYRSTKYPSTAFAYAHDLEPRLRNRVLTCFYDYRFNAEMQKAFDGADRFYPITYQRDFALVREVSDAVNPPSRTDTGGKTLQ